jgi:hypothetical protein
MRQIFGLNFPSHPRGGLIEAALPFLRGGLGVNALAHIMRAKLRNQPDKVVVWVLRPRAEAH